MPRVLGAFAVGFCFVLSASAPAAAQSTVGGATLAWTRGDGADACAAQETVQALVRGRLGLDPFRSPAAQAIEAFVTRDASGFHAALFVRAASGTLVARSELRSTSPDCDALVEAASLAIAIAIDPDVALRPHSAPSSPPPSASSSSSPPVETASASPPPEPVVPSPPPPASPRATTTTHSVRAPHTAARDVIASAALTYGVLPGVAAGTRLHTDAFVYRWFRGGAGALLLPETTVSPQGHSFAFGLTALDLSACGDVVRRGRHLLSGCANLWVGAVHSVVFDLLPVRPGDHVWAGASAEARWRVTLIGPVVAELNVAALVPLTRYQFRVQGPLGVVYEQSGVALLATAGIGLQFP